MFNDNLFFYVLKGKCHSLRSILARYTNGSLDIETIERELREREYRLKKINQLSESNISRENTEKLQQNAGIRKLSLEELAILNAKPCDEPDRSKLEATEKTARTVVIEECPQCHAENRVPYFFCVNCGTRRLETYG